MQKTVRHTKPKICYYLALHRKGLSTPGIYRSIGFNGDRLYMVNEKKLEGHMSTVNSWDRVRR